MLLGRIIRQTNGERYSILPIRFLTPIFVVGDVISFFVQAGGAGTMSNAKISDQSLGKNIIMVGLVVQILMFILFLIVAGLFTMRMRTNSSGITTGS